MYQKTKHILICGNKGLLYDSITEKDELVIAQVPLISGGFYSKLVGQKWCEVTVEGRISKSDLEYYNDFVFLVKGNSVTLSSEDTTYNHSILVQSELAELPDSRLYKYQLKFRSVENE